MTKLEEKIMLQDTLRAMSSGYVRDILGGLYQEIERAIDSDFVFIDFATRQKESDEHRLAMIEAAKQRAAIKAEIQDLERKRDHLQNGLAELRSTVARLRMI